MTDVWKEIHKVKFTKALKEYRAKKGISIRKLAVATGLSASYLSYLERGIHGPPSIEATKRIAEALEVNSDILLAEAGHVDREITEAISKNPEQITSAIRKADSSEEWLWKGALAVAGLAAIILAPNLDFSDETPESVHESLKQMLKDSETSKKTEKEYFQFAEEVLNLWRKDFEK